jgi:hypothetical protein
VPAASPQVKPGAARVNCGAGVSLGGPLEAERAGEGAARVDCGAGVSPATGSLEGHTTMNPLEGRGAHLPSRRAPLHGAVHRIQPAIGARTVNGIEPVDGLRQRLAGETLMRVSVVRSAPPQTRPAPFFGASDQFRLRRTTLFSLRRVPGQRLSPLSTVTATAWQVVQSVVPPHDVRAGQTADKRGRFPSARGQMSGDRVIRRLAVERHFSECRGNRRPAPARKRPLLRRQSRSAQKNRGLGIDKLPRPAQ